MPGLSDFRIESDAVIKLTLSNGQSYRVSPKDLDRYLSREDVAKIRQALRLRSQFMHRILPPLVMVGLVASILALGSHDMQRVRALIHPQAAAPQKAQLVKPTQSQASTGQPTATSSRGAVVAAAAAAADGPGSVTVGRSHAASARSVAPAQSSAGSSAAATPKGKALGQTDQPVLAPVTKTVKDVAQPVSKAVGGVLHDLP